MVLADRTREEIRVDILDNLGGLPPRTATANGSTTTIIDATLEAADNIYNGWWIVFTSGTNDGRIRQVDDYDGTSTRGTLTIRATGTTLASTASGDTFELWAEKYPPERIQNLIQQAIRETYGLAFDPVEDTSLYANGEQARFDIPTGLSMINRLEYRSSISKRIVHLCGRLFDETTDSDFTQANDDEDFREGRASLKLTIGASAAAGDFITDSFTAIDISGYTHIEGWVKSTVALSAADFVIRLDSGAVQGDSSDLEVLSVPAAAIDTWTYFSIALAVAESDTALVSIGIEMNADIGAATVWFDGIVAVKNDTAAWRPLRDDLWRIDKQARDLILTNAGRTLANDAMLKIVGGDAPLELAADSDVNEVDDQFVIARTTELALASDLGGADAAEVRARISLWHEMAERAKRSIHLPVNTRLIE